MKRGTETPEGKKGTRAGRTSRRLVVVQHDDLGRAVVRCGADSLGVEARAVHAGRPLARLLDEDGAGVEEAALRELRADLQHPLVEAQGVRAGVGGADGAAPDVDGARGRGGGGEGRAREQKAGEVEALAVRAVGAADREGPDGAGHGVGEGDGDGGVGADEVVVALGEEGGEFALGLGGGEEAGGVAGARDAGFVAHRDQLDGDGVGVGGLVGGPHGADEEAVRARLDRVREIDGEVLAIVHMESPVESGAVALVKGMMRPFGVRRHPTGAVVGLAHTLDGTKPGKRRLCVNFSFRLVICAKLVLSEPRDKCVRHFEGISQRSELLRQLLRI